MKRVIYESCKTDNANKGIVEQIYILSKESYTVCGSFIHHSLNIPLLLPRHLPHLPPQPLRPLAHTAIAVRRQKRQARAALFQQIPRPTIQNRLRHLHSRSRDPRHAVTGRALTAQEQTLELCPCREAKRTHLRRAFLNAI